MSEFISDSFTNKECFQIELVEQQTIEIYKLLMNLK